MPAPKNGVPSLVMQSYRDMGTHGRRRMQIAGSILMAASTAYGLTVPPFFTVPAVYLLFVGMIFLVGVGFFWPQYGAMALDTIPTAIAKVLPARRIVDALYPDRRTETREEEK